MILSNLIVGNFYHSGETVSSQPKEPEMEKPSARTLFGLLAILAIVALGLHIPLPVLNFDLAAVQIREGTSRFSIFALGLIPYFTVLIYFKLVALVFPALERWCDKASDNAVWIAFSINGIALAIAGQQGFGILQALASSGLVKAQMPFVELVAVSCYVGSTALLIWLIGRVRVPGVGNALWLILAVPLLADFPGSVASFFGMIHIGSIPGWNLYVLVLYIVGISVLIVFVSRALFSQKTVEPRLLFEPLLWSPFLSGAVVGLLLSVLSILGADIFLASFANLQAYSILTALLMPLFVWFYARRLLTSHGETARKIIVTRCVAIGSALVVIGLASQLIATTFPYLLFNLNGPLLVGLIATLVGLSRTSSSDE